MSLRRVSKTTHTVPEEKQHLTRAEQLLSLEQIDPYLFRGFTPKTYFNRRIYGGQTIAQSLMAAYMTVGPEYVANSLHGLFVRGGELDVPILYHVKNLRNGRSFCQRLVTAVQRGKNIYSTLICFQRPEKGWEHQGRRRDTTRLPSPDVLKCKEELIAEFCVENKVNMLKARQEFLQSMMDLPLMFQYKPMDPIEYKSLLAYKDESPPAISRPTRHAWVKSDSEAALPDDLRVHQCLLAYISDHGLMTTSLKPHGKSFFHGINPSGFASLDHSMWFHRPFRLDTDWLLYETVSPLSAAARGLTFGCFYTRAEGKLVVSLAQECVIRPMENLDDGQDEAFNANPSAEAPAYALPSKL